jgi:hypothetical protein
MTVEVASVDLSRLKRPSARAAPRDFDPAYVAYGAKGDILGLSLLRDEPRGSFGGNLRSKPWDTCCMAPLGAISQSDQT